MEYIIVQAGGKGTRMRHLTENKPKALVVIENLPLVFHLFKKYSDKKFIIISDYKKEVMREYLHAFAKVKYMLVEAAETGTCAGIRKAIELIPEAEPYMLVWSDLILDCDWKLPDEYENEENKPSADYIGISGTFECRWKYENGIFSEEKSSDYGVAGLFLFTDKRKLENVPESGEFVRWLHNAGMRFEAVPLAGAKEIGLYEEYEKLEVAKCRPFNKITVKDDVLVKEPMDERGAELAVRESRWYRKAKRLGVHFLPEIYGVAPLKMEYIKGKNIYECDLQYEQKLQILEYLVKSLKTLHSMEQMSADPFSIKEVYFNKTLDRLAGIQDLIPFGRERYITVNGRKCRNVYYYKSELEKRLDDLVMNCKEFSFIHGDCTFSNMMLRENGELVLIDPRGYFGYTELLGDARYDWAKVYYSILGNYDRFNLKCFQLHIGENSKEGVRLEIESNQWEDLTDEFIKMVGADEGEIKLLHAVIWLSLTTYAWQDYDSICGAFYNGIFYMEEVL